MRRERMSGQGLVEYALIIILIALAVVGALSLVGTTLNEFYFNQIANLF